MQYIHLLIVLFFSLGTVKSSSLNKNFKEVGKQFVDFYYAFFTGNAERKSQIENILDKDEPIFSFEGEEVRGIEQIMETINGLRYTLSIIQELDALPTIDDNGVMVHVTGQLKDEDERLQSFTQAFWLKSVENRFVIKNSIFRTVEA